MIAKYFKILRQKIAQFFKMLWCWYSFHYSGWNYRDYKCNKITGCEYHGRVECGRTKHHFGNCRCYEG